MDILKENNIKFSGAGKNSYEAYLPEFFVLNGVNVSLIAVSDRHGQYCDWPGCSQPYINSGYNKPGFANATVFDILEKAGEVNTASDLTVVELHAGEEYEIDLFPDTSLVNQLSSSQSFWKPIPYADSVSLPFSPYTQVFGKIGSVVVAK